MVNSIKIMSSEIKSVNCYPQCVNPDIVPKLQSLNPCIDVAVMHSETLLAGSGGENAEKLKKLITDRKQFATNDGKVPDWKVSVFDSLYGLLSLMTASIQCFYQDIPIKSSPQIHINNGAGWKPTQSLTKFVQSLLNEGIAGWFTHGTGINGIIDAAASSIDTWGGFLGWSPQVSPYFSFKENPFSNKPSLNIEIVLINDNNITAEQNAEFLNLVVRDALVASGTARAEKRPTTSSLLNRWYPPKLFNVYLKFGSHKRPVKEFHLCTLDATVTAEGVIRGGIPDAYDVKLNFTSLLPDTMDLWLPYEFPNTSSNKTDDIITPDMKEQMGIPISYNQSSSFNEAESYSETYGKPIKDKAEPSEDSSEQSTQ